MFYKWKLVIFPDEKSRLCYYVSPVIEVISPETFKDYHECIQAGREYDMDLPESYSGPFLQVISSMYKDILEDIFKNHKNGKIHETYKAYASACVEDIDEIQRPAGAAQHCKLLQNIEDKKLKVLQKEDKDFCPSSLNTEEYLKNWKLEPRYRPKWEDCVDLGWHQEISHNIEVVVSHSSNRGHPKLYLYKGRQVVPLNPTELCTLVQMYDSIMVKMYECRHWKTDIELQQDEWTDQLCKSGRGCTHE